MTNFVPFEPDKGMEGHFVPYEAIEEGLAPTQETQLQPLPATDNNSSSLQETE